MQSDNTFLTYHVLKSFYGAETVHARYMAESTDDNRPQGATLKNVCAKVSPVLVDRIDNAIALLDITKTQFAEAAFLQLLDNLDDVLAKYGHASLRDLEQSQ